MRGKIILGAVVLVIAAAVYIMWPSISEAPGAQSQTATYTSSEYGISFVYPRSYALTEHDTGGGERRSHAIVLMKDTPENRALISGETPSEGPPTITIQMFQNNLDHYTTEGWIRGVSDSNFKLSEGRLATTTISGQEALSYRWSGLYEGTTIVQARPAWVYAFTVNYEHMGDDIVQDFVAVRDSVVLQ